MDPETGVDGESPVQLLLLQTEVPCRFGHRDDLRLIDFICLPMSHHGRSPIGEDVSHPISAFSIREGDQKAVVVLNRYDWGLVAPSRTASNVTDNRGGGLFRPG